MTSPIRKFTIKLVIYGAFLLYLVGDFFIWHGLFAGQMDAYLKPVQGPAGDQSAHIAQVYGEALTSNQQTRRVEELKILRQPPVLDMGENATLTHELDVSRELRPRAMYDLIGSSLLRLKTRFNDLQLPNRGIEAGKILEQIESRFNGNREQYLQALHQQKMTEDKLRDKITARLKQTEQLYRATIQVSDPSEEELKTYYELIRDQLKTPDLRQVRHIYLATLHQDEQKVTQEAQNILDQLHSGASFDQLAKKFSNDERTAVQGGNLGWISPARAKETLNLDITALPNDTPVLVKSNWGWHIVKASPVKKGRIPSYEEARPSLKTAAQNLRKVQAIDLYMDGLFEEGHLKNRIKIKKDQPSGTASF